MQKKEMSTLSKELLLGGLLYFRSCREQYIQACKDTVATLIDSEGTLTAYSIIERTIRLFITVDVEVKPVIIMRKLIADINKLPPANTKLIEQYLDVIEQLDDQSKFTEQLCSNVLMEQSTVTILSSAVDELKKLKSVPEVQKQLRKTAEKLAGVSGPGKLTLYNPVMAAKDVLVHRDKIPTGITFLDYLLGGGIVWGEHGGCLGPPSGGKSLLANMLLCNLAIQGHDVMLLQFEQSVKYNSDIMSRIYAYLTRLPRSEFADKGYDELSDKARQALQACEKVSSHIRVGSFTDDTVARTVETIIETIEDSIKSGFTPKMVIIDWLGAVVSEFLASATGTDANYPILAQQIQDSLVSYGKERNISFFFLHQSSNDAAAKPPSYRPSMFDSYFFRGFSQKLEFCLELGTKSKQPGGRFACWLHCGKVRGAEPDKSVVILLDGANAKMEATRDGEYVINSKGQFVEVSRALIDDSAESLDTTPSEVEASYLAGFGG